MALRVGSPLKPGTVSLPSVSSQSGYRGRGSGAAKAGKKAGKNELTEEQKQEIREAFDLFDTDGSGNQQCPSVTLF